MATLDFEKRIHSLDSLDEDTLCTVLVFIPNGIDDSTNDRLKEAFNNSIDYIGLSHIDSDGFKTDKGNAIFVDNPLSVEHLKEICSICEDLNVIPLSFYIKYKDLDDLDGPFIGRAMPIL